MNTIQQQVAYTVWDFWRDNKELIVGGLGFLAYFFRDKLFPAWMSTRRAERETQASLTDRLFEVLDRQVKAMEQTGQLIRDMSLLLPSIAQSLAASSSMMISKHDLTHSMLREVISRLDAVESDVHTIRGQVTEIARAQGVLQPTLPKRKAARIAPLPAHPEKEPS